MPTVVMSRFRNNCFPMPQVGKTDRLLIYSSGTSVSKCQSMVNSLLLRIVP